MAPARRRPASSSFTLLALALQARRRRCLSRCERQPRVWLVRGALQASASPPSVSLKLSHGHGAAGSISEVAGPWRGGGCPLPPRSHLAPQGRADDSPAGCCAGAAAPPRRHSRALSVAVGAGAPWCWLLTPIRVCYSSPWNPSWLYSTTPGDWSCARSRHWPPSSNYTHDVGCQQGVDGTAMRFSR